MSEQADRDALVEVLATHATFDTRDKGWPCRWSCICGTVIREPQDSRHLPELHIVHVTDALLEVLAQRDRRVRAEALREFADRFRLGDGNPWALHVRSRARRSADRIEAGE